MNLLRRFASRRWLLAVGCYAILAPVARAETQYQVIDLGGAGASISEGTAVNSIGRVAGYLLEGPGDSIEHAYVYDGAGHDIGTLGGSFSTAEDINSSGNVVGASNVTGDSSEHAFVYNGTMHDIGTLGGSHSGAYGINSSGNITGYATTLSESDHIFLYDSVMHDLGIGLGYGINDSNQLTGQLGNGHAFFYDVTMHDIGTLGGDYSEGHRINSHGDITGSSFTTPGDITVTHAFLFDGDMHDLGTLGGRFSTGLGINDIGQVVGNSSFSEASGAIHAFLYTSNSGMIDLNTLIDPRSGWILGSADDINNAGQITGGGTINGEGHAFLLIPVPEPSGFVLAVLAGIVALIIGRCRLAAAG